MSAISPGPYVLGSSCRASRSYLVFVLLPACDRSLSFVPSYKFDVLTLGCCATDASPSCSPQSEEECLRPSLIRRKCQPFWDTTNVQCSPLQSIQALTSPVPSPSTRPAHSCFSPNAETDLFGSPAPSPMSRHQCYVKQRTTAQSPSLQQLQHQHTALLKNLAVSPLQLLSFCQAVKCCPKCCKLSSCYAHRACNVHPP